MQEKIFFAIYYLILKFIPPIFNNIKQIKNIKLNSIWKRIKTFQQFSTKITKIALLLCV